LNYVRQAIFTKLELDSDLLDELGDGTGDGTDTILGPREATSETPKPFLEVAFDGGRSRNHIGAQTWAIYCYHDRQFTKAATILKLVKDNLDRQVCTADSDGGIAVMECEFIGDTPDSYDRLLKLDINGQLYRVHTVDI